MNSQTDHHDMLNGYTTEMVDPRFTELDLLSTYEMVQAMNEAEQEVPRAVARAGREISQAIDAIAPRVRSGGRMFYVGAGTPGRLGVLDASECPPTFSTQPHVVQGIIAGGFSALTHAIEGAEDDEQAGRQDLVERAVNHTDVVIGITASGRTPYVLAAVEYARECGALTVGISSNIDAELSRLVDHPIEVVVGPEIISGSTRLKAGSAQKQVLNMISTLTMVKLGKTYGNLMVDVAASNEKLRARAQNLVMRITGVGREQAIRALESSGGDVKTAVVCIVRGVDPRRARELLVRADGFLRSAISSQ
ncbi:N-acetylmuramic acid 6-phosphate etherase [Trueperella sp. LYQ143]|uniref:N-acetylmuramic acid 6-phosphate etherase n=1 Tax=unclassified Trueperella TaxID=2630174 RepID=UPI003982EA3F